MIQGITQFAVQCSDQYDKGRTSESIKTTASYSSESTLTGSAVTDSDQFICGIKVATENSQQNNEGIYGLQVKFCPVVRCEQLLIKGNSVSSKTEKLIEGETRYEYLDIFPNFIKNLDDSGDCGTISCKLLNKCQPNDEIISTNILITSDFRIQMDTDPANEFYYDLCVACSNRNTTIYSDNFFLHTYYPCEDELKPRNSVPSQSEQIVPQNAGVYAETKIQYNITELYLVNSDTDHCDVKNCIILQGGIGLSEEFFWADKDFININTDPKEEFYLENLQVQCSNRNITVISPSFSIQSNCTNNIIAWTPANFQTSQEYDATTNNAQKSAFVFDSFLTTTSACQVENYYLYISTSNKNLPTGMTQLNPILDAHTLRVENANSFSLPVIDGTNPFQFIFTIYLEINGGSTWHVDNLVLTTKCPSVLEFYQVSYNDAVESYIGAPIGDSMITFPATIPTLPKCNDVNDYRFSVTSYKDLAGNTQSQTSDTLKFYEGCNSSPCMTLQFDTTKAGEILYKIQPVDLESQAPESSQLSIKIFENPQPPRISNFLLYASVTDGDSNKQETNPQLNVFVTESVVFTFQPFKCSTATCVVTNYQLSSSSSSLVSPSGVSGPTLNSQTGMMEIALDDYNVLGVYQFYIYANLQLFNQVEVYTNQVTITVECGNEVITTSPSRLVLPVYWRNDGTKIINFSEAIASYFTVSKTQCPVTKYVAYSDSQRVNVWADSQIVLADGNQPFNSRLDISTTQPFKLTLYLEAQTQLGVKSSSLLEIEAVVCGNELIQKKLSPDQLYVKQIGESLQFTSEEYSSYFFRSFDTANSAYECTAVKEYTVFSDSTCTVTSSRIQMDESIIKIDTSTPFSISSFCIKAETVGGNHETQIFNVEVCGTETVSISSNGNANSISKIFPIPQISMKIDIEKEGFFAQTSSSNCGIIRKRLVEADQLTNLTQFSFVNNLIGIESSEPYDGTFYLEYSATTNVARLPIYLKICGYEQVIAEVESPQRHEIQKYDYKQAFRFSFKSNDSICEISHYNLFDQETGLEITDSKVITFDQSYIYIDPQQSEDLYLGEQLTFYLEATSTGNNLARVSYIIDLIPRINPSDLANYVNYGPYFIFKKPYYQYHYYPQDNIINFQTGGLKKKIHSFDLPLIQDDEFDKILSIEPEDITYKIYLKGAFREMIPPPTFFYFQIQSKRDLTQGQQFVKLKIRNEYLNKPQKNEFLIQVKLRDDRGAYQFEEIYVDILVEGQNAIDFRDVEAMKVKEFPFVINGKPTCEMMQRVISFEVVYNCTLYTEDWELYTNIIEPSIIIEMPTEEFYQKIQPEVGFQHFRGVLSGAKAWEALSRRIEEGYQPVEFGYLLKISETCIKYLIEATAAPDGSPCVLERQLVREEDRGTELYANAAYDGLRNNIWRGSKNDYTDILKVDSIDDIQVEHPEFTKIRMIQTERLQVLKLFFSKEMFQIPQDQIKMLNQIFEITTISEVDSSKYEANWIIDNQGTKIVVTKTKKEVEVLKSEAYKKLRFNCTYYKQDATALYFKIDFEDPLWVSQSPFGKDQISVKIKPNELIKDLQRTVLKQFNQPLTERLKPQPYTYEDLEMIESTIQNAQLFIMFLQANMLILNILLSKSLQDLWGMLNTQQITIHMMLFRCSYAIPSNMFVFNSYMSQLTQKDMYPSDEIFALIFEFTEKDSPIEHFETLGYEGTNFVSMTGSLLINICISVFLSIFLRVAEYLAKKLYRWKYPRYIGSRITHSNAIGAILTLYLQGFLEMLICILVSIGEMEAEDFQSNGSDIFAALFAVFSAAIMGFLLVFILYILKFDPNEPGMMSELHSFIYADISMESRLQSFFLCIFLLRRAFFVCIIYFLEPYLGLQLILHIISTIFYTAYFAVVKPYTTHESNEWEIFNEVCVIIVSYSLMFLSQYDENAMTRYHIGWIYILLISFNIFCNGYKIFTKMVTQTIPEGYRKFKKFQQIKNDNRRLEQWLEDKEIFCKDHPEIKMTKIIKEIAEITRYLQQNEQKVEIQDRNLQQEINWLKNHGLKTDVLDQEVAKVSKLKKELSKKEKKMKKLNVQLQKQFNKINQNIRERAIREANLENRHQLRDHGITFESVVLETEKQQAQYTRAQTQVQLAFKPNKIMISKSKTPGKKKGIAKKGAPKKGKKKVNMVKKSNMNIQDDFVMENNDLDDIMRKNGGSTPKFGEK